jgi:hypothetical protein
MKKRYLITGGTGLVGSALVKELNEQGHSVHILTRNPGAYSSVDKRSYFKWDLNQNFIDPKAFAGVEHIIHLAGANIAGGRWSDDYKKELVDSRISATRLLISHLEGQGLKVKSIVSSSAVGFYGSYTNNSSKLFSEEDSPESIDFLSDLCLKWEAELQELNSFSDCGTILRFGLVLSKDGGLFQRLKPVFELYQGAVLGGGSQGFSWIHIKDLTELIFWGEVHSGIFNAVSPDPVSNARFTRLMNRAMGKFSILPKVPAFLLKTIFGELSTLFLKGQYVSAQKIIDRGFEFEHNNLEETLNNLLKKSSRTN